MAPEQFQEQPHPASDQYALGMVVYEWLCCERPFNGGVTEVATQHLALPPPPLRSKLPNLSPLVEDVVRTVLAKDHHAALWQRACLYWKTRYTRNPRSLR